MTTTEKTFPITRSDAEWRALLTPEQYRVMRDHGTERPGSCALLMEKRAGVFSCVGCDTPLFRAGRKFESGTGWPSFDDPLPDAVETSVNAYLINTGSKLVLVDTGAAASLTTGTVSE